MRSPHDPVIVLLSARARPGREDALREAFRALVTASRSDPGCVSYEVHEVGNDPGRVVLYECWTSRAALDAHLDTPALRSFQAGAPELLADRFEDTISFLHPLRPASDGA